MLVDSSVQPTWRPQHYCTFVKFEKRNFAKMISKQLKISIWTNSDVFFSILGSEMYNLLFWSVAFQCNPRIVPWLSAPVFWQRIDGHTSGTEQYERLHSDAWETRIYLHIDYSATGERLPSLTRLHAVLSFLLVIGDWSERDARSRSRRPRLSTVPQLLWTRKIKELCEYSWMQRTWTSLLAA